MVDFADLAKKIKDNAQMVKAVKDIIADLKKPDVIKDGISQKEIEDLLDARITQVSGMSTFSIIPGYSATLQDMKDKALTMLKTLKGESAVIAAGMDTKEKAEEFLNGFDALLSAKNEKEAKEAAKKANDTAPNAMTIIFGALLSMLGLPQEQVNALMSQFGVGAPSAGGAPAAGTPATGTGKPGAASATPPAPKPQTPEERAAAEAVKILPKPTAVPDYKSGLNAFSDPNRKITDNPWLQHKIAEARSELYSRIQNEYNTANIGSVGYVKYGDGKNDEEKTVLLIGSDQGGWGGQSFAQKTQKYRDEFAKLDATKPVDPIDNLFSPDGEKNAIEAGKNKAIEDLRVAFSKYKMPEIPTGADIETLIRGMERESSGKIEAAKRENDRELAVLSGEIETAKRAREESLKKIPALMARIEANTEVMNDGKKGRSGWGYVKASRDPGLTEGGLSNKAIQKVANDKELLKEAQDAVELQEKKLKEKATALIKAQEKKGELDAKFEGMILGKGPLYAAIEKYAKTLSVEIEKDRKDAEISAANKLKEEQRLEAEKVKAEEDKIRQKVAGSSGVTNTTSTNNPSVSAAQVPAAAAVPAPARSNFVQGGITAQAQADLAQTNARLREAKAELKQLEDPVFKLKLKAAIETAEAEYPVRGGKYHASANVSYGVNGTMNNYFAGINIDQTPNLLGRYNDKVERAMRQADASEARREFNLAKDFIAEDEDNLRKEILRLESDRRTLKDELIPIPTKLAEKDMKALHEKTGIPMHIFLEHRDIVKTAEKLADKRKLEKNHDAVFKEKFVLVDNKYETFVPDPMQSKFANDAARKHSDQMTEYRNGVINQGRENARQSVIEASANNHREIEGLKGQMLAMAREAYAKELEGQVAGLEKNLAEIRTSRTEIISAADEIKRAVTKILEENPKGVAASNAQAEKLNSEADKLLAQANKAGGQEGARMLRDAAELIKQAITAPKVKADDNLVDIPETEQITEKLNTLTKKIGNTLGEDKVTLERSINDLSEEIDNLKVGFKVKPETNRTSADKNNLSPGKKSLDRHENLERLLKINPGSVKEEDIEVIKQFIKDRSREINNREESFSNPARAVGRELFDTNKPAASNDKLERLLRINPKPKQVGLHLIALQSEFVKEHKLGNHGNTAALYSRASEICHKYGMPVEHTYAEMIAEADRALSKTSPKQDFTRDPIKPTHVDNRKHITPPSGRDH